jgi:hypothetical protein
MVLMPTVLLALAAMLAADYRYQLDALMDAHAAHTMSVALDPAPKVGFESPDAAARRSLRSHALYGGALLVMLALAADAALSILVLRPTAALRNQLSRIERGQWHVVGGARHEYSRDELGDLCEAFQRLGPELGALMLQTLRAERLAATALVTKRFTCRIEHEVQAIARTVAALLEHPLEPEEVARVIAPAAGRIVQALREFDPAFADAQRRKSRCNRANFRGTACEMPQRAARFPAQDT